MLRIRFLNVAEGDSILIEDIEQTQCFRLLVDTGRETISDPKPCALCAEHLKAQRIDRIDKVVITHLHSDHAGGLERVLDTVSVGTIISGFIPFAPGKRCHLPSKINKQIRALDNRDEKQVRGLSECLDRWSADIARAIQKGVGTRELYRSWHGVQLTPQLTADFIVPDAESYVGQREVYNAMLAGGRLPIERMVGAARLRNPNSLRVRLYYAGRVIELSGDCYGTVWENDELQPCDILKVPHHGDAKSMTGQLTTKLRPKHAVICCSSRYVARKDRPSAAVAGMLRDSGAAVWYTDAYRDGVEPPRSVASTDFVIEDDGTLRIPKK